LLLISQATADLADADGDESARMESTAATVQGNSPDEARRHYELLVEDVDGMNPARHRCACSSAPHRCTRARPRAVARFRLYTSPSFPVKMNNGRWKWSILILVCIMVSALVWLIRI
jgi:hypothetical protein